MALFRRVDDNQEPSLDDYVAQKIDSGLHFLELGLMPSSNGSAAGFFDNGGQSLRSAREAAVQLSMENADISRQTYALSDTYVSKYAPLVPLLQRAEESIGKYNHHYAKAKEIASSDNLWSTILHWYHTKKANSHRKKLSSVDNQLVGHKEALDKGTTLPRKTLPSQEYTRSIVRRFYDMKTEEGAYQYTINELCNLFDIDSFTFYNQLNQTGKYSSRQKRLDDKTINKILEAYATTDSDDSWAATVDEIAQEFDVSSSTVYYHARKRASKNENFSMRSSQRKKHKKKSTIIPLEVILEEPSDEKPQIIPLYGT